ncbi:MAG: hypothetical protein AB1478_11715, partial [Nitrospirota bacterium]
MPVKPIEYPEWYKKITPISFLKGVARGIFPLRTDYQAKLSKEIESMKEEGISNEEIAESLYSYREDLQKRGESELLKELDELFREKPFAEKAGEFVGGVVPFLVPYAGVSRIARAAGLAKPFLKEVIATGTALPATRAYEKLLEERRLPTAKELAIEAGAGAALGVVPYAGKRIFRRKGLPTTKELVPTGLGRETFFVSPTGEVYGGRGMVETVRLPIEEVGVGTFPKRWPTFTEREILPVPIRGTERGTFFVSPTGEVYGGRGIISRPLLDADIEAAEAELERLSPVIEKFEAPAPVSEIPIPKKPKPVKLTERQLSLGAEFPKETPKLPTKVEDILDYVDAQKYMEDPYHGEIIPLKEEIKMLQDALTEIGDIGETELVSLYSHYSELGRKIA